MNSKEYHITKTQYDDIHTAYADHADIIISNRKNKKLTCKNDFVFDMKFLRDANPKHSDPIYKIEHITRQSKYRYAGRICFDKESMEIHSEDDLFYTIYKISDEVPNLYISHMEQPIGAARHIEHVRPSGRFIPADEIIRPDLYPYDPKEEVSILEYYRTEKEENTSFNEETVRHLFQCFCNGSSLLDYGQCDDGKRRYKTSEEGIKYMEWIQSMNFECYENIRDRGKLLITDDTKHLNTFSEI